MSNLTVGIVGAGRIGQLHADNIISSAKMTLKALADIDVSHLAGTRFSDCVPVITTDTEALFNDPEIDAVFICTSTDTHCHFIKKAAVAGKHIFCEKPISFNINETNEVLQIVKDAGVKMQIGFNRRYDKHFKHLRDMIKAGKIGQPHIIKITSRDPETPPEEYIKRSGGMFMDMTIHDFDMVRYLASSEVKQVFVATANLIDEKFARNEDVDTAIINLTFEDGSLAVIDNSRQAVYGYDQRIEAFGDKGVVTVDNEQKTNVQISTKETVTIDHPKYFFLDRYKDAFVTEINHFAASIIDGTPLLCTGEDGLEAQRLALAARLSWKENRPVLLSEIENDVKMGVTK
ncbi:inositol 2-dehydrogenase [Radiobacillus sp. PE A8.2]|uniref:inositol 2-dehydrogenase n=1 Tax=Radiobacillus sp. PE A8.2 TaxID=3380349 RepID=UPI00388D5313